MGSLTKATPIRQSTPRWVLLAAGLSAHDAKVQASTKLRFFDLARYELNPEHVTELIKEWNDAIKFFGGVAAYSTMFSPAGCSARPFLLH